jgi:NAD(P)-dependent dehydrogenase (short-subunit alcohol dehydrogenase family)
LPKSADELVSTGYTSEQVKDALGGLDILVNCAAGNFLAAADELTPNGFRTGEGVGTARYKLR